MKITVFSKDIEINENNKGIKFFLEEMCDPICEVTITYEYRLRRLINDKTITTEQAADELREMSPAQLKKEILLNIKEQLDDHDFSKEYSKYII